MTSRVGKHESSYSPAAGVVAYLILNLGYAAMTILFLKTHQTDIDRWGEIDDIV